MSAVIGRISSSSMTFGLCVITMLLAPGIGYGPIYLSHFAVVICLGAFWIHHRFEIERADLALMAILSAIILYCGTWFSLQKPHDLNIAKHSAMVLISFATCGSAFLLAKYIASKATVRNSILIAFAIVVCTSSLEILFGIRLPVSRYFDVFSYAPTGFYGNENNLGVILWMMTVSLCVMCSSRWSFLVLVVASQLGIMTGSRIIAVLFIVTAIYFVVDALWRGTRFGGLRPWLALGGAALALELVAVTLLRDMPRLAVAADAAMAATRGLEEVALNHDSIGVRAELTLQAAHLFSMNPWLGVGPGRSSELISASHFQSGLVVNLHNPVFEIVLEYGVLGSSLWLAGWLVLVAKIWRRRQLLGASSTGFGLFLLFVAPIAVIALSTLYYFTAFWAVLGLFVGFSERKQVTKTTSHADRADRVFPPYTAPTNA